MIRFRTIFLVMTVITLLVLLAPILLGLISALFTYHGKCYGFTDGSWACSWQEYAPDQVFWSAVLDIPLSMYIIPCWLVALGFWIYKRRTTPPNGLPLSMVMLIPLGGYLGGGCLISIFPVFIRLYYGSYP
jgi:hypothetical protein